MADDAAVTSGQPLSGSAARLMVCSSAASAFVSAGSSSGAVRCSSGLHVALERGRGLLGDLLHLGPLQPGVAVLLVAGGAAGLVGQRRPRRGLPLLAGRLGGERLADHVDRWLFRGVRLDGGDASAPAGHPRQRWPQRGAVPGAAVVGRFRCPVRLPP